MKFFTNKSIWSKIVIILIFVLLFEFVVTKPTLASGAEVGETVCRSIVGRWVDGNSSIINNGN